MAGFTPPYKGTVIGQAYEYRTGTNFRTFMVEKEDPDDPGANILERVRIAVPVKKRVIWTGRSWEDEDVWLAKARALARPDAPKPKTVLRKAR